LSKVRTPSLGSRATHVDGSLLGATGPTTGGLEAKSNVELGPGGEKRPTTFRISSLWSSALVWLMDGFAAYALALYAAAAASQQSTGRETDAPPCP
jgi:hypothetical protein